MIGDDRYIYIPQHIPDDSHGNYPYSTKANPEWLSLRIGCLTGSKADAAFRRPAVKKDGEARKNAPAELKARILLKEALVFERIENLTMPGYVSEYMRHGLELEDSAIMAYGYKMGVDVERVGFVYHPTIKFAGASWDGYVHSQRRIVQIKCPAPHTHWSYLMAGVIPDEYLFQMKWEMACEPEMEANDFVSFCPEMRSEHQLFIRRLYRKDCDIAALEKDAESLLAEVAVMTEARLKWLSEYAESVKEMREPEHEREEMPDELFITDGDINL